MAEPKSANLRYFHLTKDLCPKHKRNSYKLSCKVTNNEKMDKICEQIPHQRRHMNILWAHERRLNITVIREIQIKTTTGDHYIPTRKAKVKRQKRKPSVGCWISHTLPVGMLNGAATVEKSLAISYIKLNIHLPYVPAIPLLSFHWRKENICPQKSVYVNVHTSFVHSSWKAETTQVFSHRTMHKSLVGHLYDEHCSTIKGSICQCTRQHGRISEALCWVKAVLCSRLHTIWYNLWRFRTINITVKKLEQ